MNGVYVKVYSRAREGLEMLSTNFKVNEFACPDGSDPIFVSPELVDVLQKIRNYFCRPITIKSGYRTPTKNKAVGGTTDSQHLYGTAADIIVKGIDPKKVAAYAEALLPYTGGIGIHETFVHIDVRSEKTRWKG